MAGPHTTWVVDEQQVSFVQQVFDLLVHDQPVEIGLEDIDEAASLAMFQNRTEMSLDEETVEILAMYLEDGVSMPMPLVWKRDNRSRKVVVLDGNHRIAAALRFRGEGTCQAVLVTGDSQLAQRLALVVNTQHGRSTRNPEYVATSMRLLREQGLPLPQIARMFGVSEARVGLMTRRDAQTERVRKLIPERHTRIPAHTLDLLGQVEDEHIRVMGELFLDSPKALQEEAVRKLKSAPSADRLVVAHEIVGELREIERARRKVKATSNRPATQLQSALSRLVTIIDPTRAYYAATDPAKAVMKANLGTVLPRLERLWTTINEPTGVV